MASIQDVSTVITLRQSSFINNDAGNGDEMFTKYSPTISLINTYFNNPNSNNNIYEDSGTPTWKTCSDNLCTEEPFTGTCNAVNSTNSKLGAICPATNGIWDYVSTTNTGSFTRSADCTISSNNHVAGQYVGNCWCQYRYE